MSVTESELLAALAASQGGTSPEDARTAQEMAAESGLSIGRVRMALHALERQSRLQVHWVVRPRIDGRPARVAAYTILPAS